MKLAWGFFSLYKFVQEIKITYFRNMKTPTQNIVNTLTGKRVLFLENDNGLYNGLDKFESILKTNDIECKALFEVSELPMNVIVEHINEYDVIVFQTTWQTEYSKKLSDYIFALKTPKIIIEVPISDPTWYYKPKDIAHELYFYKPPFEWYIEAETFIKLSDKAYWDYENKFDQ